MMTELLLVVCLFFVLRECAVRVAEKDAPPVKLGSASRSAAKEEGDKITRPDGRGFLRGEISAVREASP